QTPTFPGQASPGKRMRVGDSPDESISNNLDNSTAAGGSSNEAPLFSFPYDGSMSNDTVERWTDAAFQEGSIDHLRHSLWPDLTRQISELVENAFPAKCQWELLSEATQRDLESFCPKAKYLIQDTEHKGAQALFEAWLWRILHHHLLSPDCTTKWKGERWRSLGTLLQTMKRSLNTSHHCMTAIYHSGRYEMYHSTYTDIGLHTCEERLRNILRNEIYPIAELRGHPENQVTLPASSDVPHIFYNVSSECLDEKIRRIGETAIAIDKWILSAKYDVEVQMAHPETGEIYGFPVGENMDVNSMVQSRFRIDLGSTVDLIYRPRLQIHGSTLAGIMVAS
ncbi:unnamed protein product, partial [Clonostachys rosea]